MFKPLRPGRRALSLLIAPAAVLLATAACSFNSPSTLNDGKGTSDKPVPAQVYAKTSDFDVRALSVVRPMEAQAPPKGSDLEYMRVQFQIRCSKGKEDVCDLSELGRNIKLVDNAGVIYDPEIVVPVDNPLQGEILGGAENAGWQVYAVPVGLPVERAIAEYGQDQRVFFTIPAVEEPETETG